MNSIFIEKEIPENGDMIEMDLGSHKNTIIRFYPPKKLVSSVYNDKVKNSSWVPKNDNIFIDYELATGNKINEFTDYVIDRMIAYGETFFVGSPYEKIIITYHSPEFKDELYNCILNMLERIQSPEFYFDYICNRNYMDNAIRLSISNLRSFKRHSDFFFKGIDNFFSSSVAKSFSYQLAEDCYYEFIDIKLSPNDANTIINLMGESVLRFSPSYEYKIESFEDSKVQSIKLIGNVFDKKEVPAPGIPN